MNRILLNQLALATLLILARTETGLGQQPATPLLQSHRQFLEMKNQSQFQVPLIQVGPVVNSARVEAVQADPTRPGIIYAAFGSGGLWKTTNNGVTWKSIFDNHASYGIGDIAIAPSNPNVIYVGTGESLKKARNFTIPGAGIYRSDDGGISWRHLGLFDSWHIGEIAVHPKNPDVALVAVLGHFWSTNANRGLYFTNDGGKSWNRVLHLDNKTGANDVVWSPSDPTIAYASLWENHPGVAGENSSIYRSNDSGKTWSKCVTGLPSGKDIGRIGLAVSSSNSKKVYALIDNREFSESAAAQIYRSLDGGNTWNKTHTSEQKFLSRIGWYFCDIYVDPIDDESIFALGVRLAHSQDGGKTFSFIGGNISHVNPSAASGLHLDQCEMWIHPQNPNHLILGNDGGLYQSFDKGKNWKHLNNIPTGEFYDIEIEQTVPYRVFAGAQDDATVFGPAKEFDPNSQQDTWQYLWIDPWNGGDGCVTLVDHNNPDTVYYSSQEGGIRRKSMKSGRSKSIRPRLPREIRNENPDARLKFNFVAPMDLSPHDSNQVLLGSNYLFSSPDRGESWSVISDDFTKIENAERKSTAISAIAESPLTRGRMYVGTDRGSLWSTENGGEEWEDRSKGLPIAYIRSIAPSRHKGRRVYVAMSGLNYDDFQSYLFCSENGGRSWKSISSNLPQEPANVILESPKNENTLFAGTFRGVYISLNRGESWSLLGNNLPACSVADLDVLAAKNELIIGTHGRGIYKFDLAVLDQMEKKELPQKNSNVLFRPSTAYLPYLSNIRPTINFRKPEKATFSFWLKEKQNVRLSVFPNSTNDRKPDPVPAFTTVISGTNGLNQFRWDLETKNTSSPNPYHVRYREYLRAGEYWLVLESAEGKRLRVPFKVEDRKNK